MNIAAALIGGAILIFVTVVLSAGVTALGLWATLYAAGIFPSWTVLNWWVVGLGVYVTGRFVTYQSRDAK